MTYTEKNLEEHIEKNLHQVGFKSLLHTEYDRVNCVVPFDLIEFIKDTQKPVYERLVEQYGPDTDKKLILRLFNEVSSRGVIDVLRKGIKDQIVRLSLPHSSILLELKNYIP